MSKAEAHIFCFSALSQMQVLMLWNCIVRCDEIYLNDLFTLNFAVFRLYTMCDKRSLFRKW
jgi:hypothetical protein